MEPQTSRTSRRPRADSTRNHGKLLAAAAEIFRIGGPEASLEAVARRAGVGIGTLYRHFPNREALFEAVYRREVEDLVLRAEDLAGTDRPAAALREWSHATVGLVATKKSMLAALALAAEGRSALYAQTFDRLTGALAVLVANAAAAGEIRSDVAAGELLWALIGLCHIGDRPNWQASVTRLVDVFVDGLRCEPPPPRS